MNGNRERDPKGRTPHYELTWPGKSTGSLERADPRWILCHTDAFDGPCRQPGALPASAHLSLPGLLDLQPELEQPAPATGFRNRLVWGDNLAAMQALLPEFAGKIDLVYLDPPFDAKQDFAIQVPLGADTGVGERKGPQFETVAYRDVWGEGDDSYLQMLYHRLPLVRELMAETGSVIVHVNWRVGHLVQMLMDEVFGPGERDRPGSPGFRNEIIWGYGGGGAPVNAYRRKHDNLFWYTRSEKWTFNPQFRPYTEKTRERGLTAVKGPQYQLREEGAALDTWWTDPAVQKILSPTAYENLKFPTQKPEALLERLLRGHSNEGDLVADFFCGSGTTGAAAEKLGRRWIMADIGRHAVHVTRRRLAQVQHELSAAGRSYRSFDVYEVGG